MINKIKNPGYTSLVLLITISSFFKTSYSTPTTVDFGGYDSSTDITQIVDPENVDKLQSFISLEEILKSVENNSSFKIYTKFPAWYKIKLNKFLFPQFVCAKYQTPAFLKLNFKKIAFNLIQLYQDDPVPHLS